MPSETLMDDVMETLGRSRQAHRTAIVGAVDELRGALAAHRNAGGDRAERLGTELGPFASGRLDPGALAAILAGEERTLAPGAVEVLERALDVMVEAADAIEEASVLRVPPAGDLRDVVRDALTATGAVFGAARAAELARNGAYRPDEHDVLFGGTPFHRWTAAERRVAPPLVVTVDGADLRPAGLADFLDGAMRIVLLVRGDAPPAALARMITPGVMVIQTRDPEDLSRVAAAPGPVLAAVFEPDAEDPVPFVHDPAAGELPGERLRVHADLDELEERLRETRWSDRTRAEDLAHLVALARTSVARVGGRETAAPASSDGDGDAAAADGSGELGGVDHLAGWLLAGAELGS